MAPPTTGSSANGRTESREARKQRLFESRREREFYSYYESVLAYASKEPKFCDLHDPHEAAAHNAVASADTTLTAFTQLAALRIGTRRAMIFFFDSTHAYIVAESTRTLSLNNESHHAPGDSLWLGFTKIPRGLSVCEVTTNLPANEGSNAQDPKTCAVAHIVNDLAEDARFCDRPYVRDGPKARFYAGVPITTPGGINIGALCVLDDEPRDGLEYGQVDLLRNLASAIMSHLELVRAKEDNQRSRDMNTALGAFVEGRSKARDWWHRSGHAPTDAQGRPEEPSNEPRIKTFSERLPISPEATDDTVESTTANEYFATKDSSESSRVTEATPIGIPPSQDPPASRNSPVDVASSNRPKFGSKTPSDGSESSGAHSHTKDDEPDMDLSARIKATASRAAGLIQNGLGADGVLFLDATVGSFGGIINGTQGLSQTETETDTSHVSDAGIRSQQQHHQEGRSPPTARVHKAIHQAKFSEKVLRSLLRRYPEGQVWHFNDDGEASGEDEYLDEECLSATSAGESAGSDVEQSTTPSSKRAAKKSHSRKKDGRVIQDIFPGIRSLVFLGMWDPHQERWFGASIALSYSSTRMFSVRNELSYLAAFCDVVLGEVWRLESQELGRSKNHFISSISHELRSPLHGILGSAECLEEQEQSALGRELIRSINSCGTTLLDVINDLLEYSRLNHGTQQRRKMALPKNAKTTSDANVTSNTPGSDSGVMVSALTEDAVNAACLGFDHQTIKHLGTSRANEEHRAVLNLVIDESQDPDWLLCVPSGSWKRICLNLVSNALKYTPSGFISVSLRKKSLQERAGRERTVLVELVVEDSGIGMSNEFQVKNLFRPFKQENNLTAGTGLGLNLVAQIVKSQGGTVQVQSSRGVGTTVKVSVPLCRPSTTHTAAEAPPLAKFSSMNANVGFFGFGALDTDSGAEQLKSKANRKLLSSLKQGCKQLGLPICAAGDTWDDNASIYIVRPESLERLFQTDDQGMRHSLLSTSNLRTSLIVICPTRDSALRIRSSPIATGLANRAQYIWLPVGPEKLADAISTCLDARTDDGHTGHVTSSLDTVQSSPSRGVNESARTLPDIHGGRSCTSTSKDVAGSEISLPERVPPKESLSHPSEAPLHRRNGSETVNRPSTPSVQLRTQLGRATSAPNRSAVAISLLLVDDNAINLRLLEVFAKKSGHPYRTAQNGQEAVSVYEKAARNDRSSDDSLNSDHGADVRLAGKPEVVLMDINMPVMDGFEAARAIRRFEKASGTPRATIIAVTGLGDTAAQELSFASGMDLFLTKPVKMKELTEILKRFQGSTPS
ncbi:hypothetical protein Q7P37_002455 [Cladosporium fusiforme]